MKKKILIIIPLVFALCRYKNNNKNPDEGGGSVTPKASLISLNTNSISLSQEKTFKLEATIDPSLSKYLLFWSIENENIASISDTGLVSAKNVGYTICMAQCGKYQARCVVEVTPYVPESSFSVSLEKTSFNLNVNDEYSLNPTVKLGNVVINNYTSSAEVSASAVVSYTHNLIKALQVGESDILVTYSYLEYSVQQLLHVVVY